MAQSCGGPPDRSGELATPGLGGGRWHQPQQEQQQPQQQQAEAAVAEQLHLHFLHDCVSAVALVCSQLKHQHAPLPLQHGRLAGARVVHGQPPGPCDGAWQWWGRQRSAQEPEHIGR